MFGKITGWLQAHPAVKTVLVVVAGAAGGAAIQGYQTGITDPAALAKLAGIGGAGALYGLFIKRPQDTGKPCGQLPQTPAAALYNPCPLKAGHPGPHLYLLKTQA